MSFEARCESIILWPLVHGSVAVKLNWSISWILLCVCFVVVVLSFVLFL